MPCRFERIAETDDYRCAVCGHVLRDVAGELSRHIGCGGAEPPALHRCQFERVQGTDDYRCKVSGHVLSNAVLIFSWNSRCPRRGTLAYEQRAAEEAELRKARQAALC